MPLIFGTASTSATTMVNPFVGEPQMPAQLKLDMSAMNLTTVTAYGILPPGTPLALSGGLLIPVGSSAQTYGVTAEAIQLDVSGAASGAATNTTIQAATDQPITVYCGGLVNRDIAEDNLARAYTSDEIAGFNIAGSQLRLTET